MYLYHHDQLCLLAYIIIIPWHAASVPIPDNIENQVGIPIIIGSVLGGAVVFILVLLVLIAVIIITAKQRSQPREKLPAGINNIIGWLQFLTH